MCIVAALPFGRVKLKCLNGVITARKAQATSRNNEETTTTEEIDIEEKLLTAGDLEFRYRDVGLQRL